MITPEQKAKIRERAGLSATSTPPVVNDRVSRFREAIAPKPEARPTLPSSMGGMTDIGMYKDKGPGRVSTIVGEEVQKAADETVSSFERAEGPLEKGLVALTLPLKAAGTTVRAAGRIVAEPLVKVAEKVGQPIVDKIEEAVPGFSEEISNNVTGAVKMLDEKSQAIKDTIGEDAYNATRDAIEVLTAGIGGNAVKQPVKQAINIAEEATETVAKNVDEMIAQPLKESLANKTSGVTESLIANINRINPTKRREFKAMQGVSEEQWLKDRGIIGTREKTVTELVNRFQDMRKNVDEALDKMPGQYRDQRITTVADEAAEFAVRVESKDSGRIVALAEKAKGVGLTPAEINEVKRFYERNIKTGYLKDPTKTAEQIQRATNRDTDIREALFDIADKNGFPNLREINKEIQASKFLADEIAGRMEGQGANNLMSLTDWIVATPGVIDPTFLSGFIGKKLFSTEGVRAFAARALAGFPEVKPIPKPDLDLIVKKAEELFKKESQVREETYRAALLADELQKSGLKIGDGERGFIMENPIPLTREEQMLIRAAKNKIEQEQIAKYILEQRAEGKAVGEGFTIQDVDNTPILNPVNKTQTSIPRIKPNMQAGKANFFDSGSAPEEALRDFLIKDLQKSGGKLNMEIETQIDEYIKFLQENPDANLQHLLRGVEMLKLQGKDVKPILDEINKPTSYEILRDKLGRFASQDK